MKHLGYGIAILLAAALFAAPAQADLIDGFEDGNISEYTVVDLGGGVAFAVTTGSAHDGTYGLAIGPSQNSWIYRADAAATVSQGDTISAWARFERTADSRIYFGFGASAAGTLSFVLAPNTGDIRLQENPGYGFTEKNTSSQGFIANKWYRMEVVWGAGGAVTGNLYDSDGSTLINSVSDTLNPAITSGGIALRGFGGIKSFDTIERVPEPAGLALLGLGVLAVVRRRRKRA